MNNKLIFLFVGLFMVTLVSADYLPHQIDTDLSVSFTDDEAGACNISTINYPNGTISTLGVVMDNNIDTFSATITSGNFSELGIVCLNIECTDGYGSICRNITYLGKELDSSKAILYIGFLGLLVLIFFLNFVGMGFLPAKNTRDEEGRILSISYLKYFRNVLWMTGYFLFLGIIFISSNLAFAFLEEELLAQTLLMIFKIGLGIAPVIVIVWLIWIFVSMFHDRQFQRMLNRGFFPQGNL